MGIDYGQLTKQVQVPITKEKKKTGGRGYIFPVQKGILTPAQVNRILQPQAVSQKQVERLLQTPKIKPIQLQTFSFKPYIPPPIIKKPILPFPFPAFGQGAGTQKRLKQLRKSKKSLSAYTSSLVAAAFPIPTRKVTRKQFKALQSKIFTGAELRQVLEIVPEENMKKQLRKVQF